MCAGGEVVVTWAAMTPAPTQEPPAPPSRIGPGYTEWPCIVPGGDWCDGHVACQAEWDQMVGVFGGDWCGVCGLATGDPLHDGWHRLVAWNRSVVLRGAQSAADAFEERLGVHDHLHGRDAVEPPQTALDLGLTPTANTYSR